MGRILPVSAWPHFIFYVMLYGTQYIVIVACYKTVTFLCFGLAHLIYNCPLHGVL